MPIKHRYHDACLSKVELPAPEMKKLEDWVANPKDFLVFITKPGVGKTYVCHAINHWLRDNKKPMGCYFTETEFHSRLRSTINLGWDFSYEINSVMKYYDFLLVDDLGVYKNDITGHGKDEGWKIETIQTLIDARYNSRLPTVFTSNFFYDQIIKNNIFPERTVDRLFATSNTIIQYHGESLRKQGL